MRSGLKLAVSGKGGVGKTTLAAALALLLARRGGNVLAVDADPDGSLAGALGLPADLRQRIVPVARHKALVEERTGATVGQYGQMFKLNPRVADIADICGCRHNGVNLVALGAIEAGGSGCACPESVLLRALVQDLVLHRDDALVMDMEAGLEHLGRATARGVDCLLAVVEPSQRAIDSGARIARMAGDIGLKDVRFVANKVASPADERFIRAGLAGRGLLGVIPFSLSIQSAERAGRDVLDGMDPKIVEEFERMLAALDGAAGSARA